MYGAPRQVIFTRTSDGMVATGAKKVSYEFEPRSVEDQVKELQENFRGYFPPGLLKKEYV